VNAQFANPWGINMSGSQSTKGSSTRTLLVGVLGAVIGLVGAIGASALGGYWANKSVETSFANQRTAQIQDQRRQVFADFMKSTAVMCSDLDTAPRDTAKLEAAVNDVLSDQERVLLVTGTDIQGPLGNLANYVIQTAPNSTGHGCDNQTYFPYVNAFIAAARRDLG